MAVEITKGTPLADVVETAQRFLASGQLDEASDYYKKALAQIENEQDVADLRRSLWIDHVGGLVAREALARSVGVVRSYLEEARDAGDPEGELALLVLLGEVLVAQEDWRGGFHVLENIHALLRRRPEALRDQGPRLLRFEGLAAFEQDDPEKARALLTQAHSSFLIAGNERLARVVEQDLQRLALWFGGGSNAIGAALRDRDLTSTSQVLLYARALRRDARFEEAVELLARHLERAPEPALRFPLIYEVVLLKQILADQDTVKRLLPLLREAAETAADPEEARAVAERLSCWQEESFIETAGKGFEARLNNARAMIQRGRLEEAEQVVGEVRKTASFPRFAAYWSFVAGELESAIAGRERPERRREQAQQALGHMQRAARLAWENSLPELYVEAIRFTGRIYANLLEDVEQASQSWARAARADELFARRQITDSARIHYLEARPTPFDETIAAVAARVPSEGARGAARVFAAMEQARGAAILASILPSDEERSREVPEASDLTACWHWCLELAGALPRDQAAWILHATPDRLYQGLLGDGILQWIETPLDRNKLSKAIDELSLLCKSKELLETSVQDSPALIPDLLARIASQLQFDRFLGKLTPKIRRLAIVAGDRLNEIPFAALPLLGGTRPSEPLVIQFALSHLPCLSAYQPLRRHALRNRGDTGLVVRPPADNLKPAGDPAGFRLLTADHASIAGFVDVLRENGPQIVRIDCHGKYSEQDALDSWLELMPGQEDDGKLTVCRFQSLPLSTCGTLVLGACESGMSQRRGQDERTGFVRAGLAAGVPAVVAARWVAADLPAQAILDSFQHRIRFLPRDEALQRSQLDILRGRWPILEEVPYPDHPARWACWSLWGDSGFQTRAGWIVRTFRARRETSL